MEKPKYLSYRKSGNIPFDPAFGRDLEPFIATLPQKMRANKKAAVENLLHIGIPSPKSESVSFIPASEIAEFFVLPSKAGTAEIPPETVWDRGADRMASDVLVFVDGHFREDLSTQKSPGLVVRPLTEVLEKDDDLAQRLTDNAQRELDAFAATAQAVAPHPVVIDIAPDTTFLSPVLLIQILASSDIPQRTARQIIFRMGRESRASILSQVREMTGKGSHIVDSSSLEIFIEPGSHLDWVTSHELSTKAKLYSKINVALQAESVFNGHYITTGSALSRQSVEARLQGEGASFQWTAAVAVSENNHAHQYLRVLHEVPGTRSSQLFKNLLSDKARTSVDGTVVVMEGAQKTDARQLINNLLLSSQAKANNKPNLMIFADDVKCSHGATSGQLDPEQLFYLKSRGLSQEEALGILVSSFLKETGQTLTHPSIKAWWIARLRSILN